MGGGRAPCCDKSKVKRGPWSPAEDMRLITFIQNYGHPNWRSLPKQAGLWRCGKSCRLRWINYLRPDVKRGNFTPEEEETIIKLHTSFGNRWSKIASFLPGRTDNEIKNVWNTHLKKKSKHKDNKNGNGNGNGIRDGEPSSPGQTFSSSGCSMSNGEQNNNNHDNQQQHSFISTIKQVMITSSSMSTNVLAADEQMVVNNIDQGQNQDQSPDEEIIDNFMHDSSRGRDQEEEEKGILEIPIIEECDIDIWGILDDLESQDLAQSYNQNQGLGDDYTKWLRYFENELELATHDQQTEPSSCNSWGGY